VGDVVWARWGWQTCKVTLTTVIGHCSYVVIMDRRLLSDKELLTVTIVSDDT